MDDSEAPDVISSRGPVALNAYLEASSSDGTKPVYRTRLMLVGQERVGKTSLMKNLSGQRINASESITDGVDASMFCAIPVDSTKPWKRQPGGRNSSVGASDDIRERILQLLKDTEEHAEKERFTKDDREGVPEFQIWDFAGQDIYYTTHQVFLSNRAVYLLVFDLRLDLDRPVKVQVHLDDKVHSRFHDLTGLGFLDFWMQSIYAYATSQTTADDDEDRPQLSPPIFIVGTHRDSKDISDDAEQRKAKIHEKFESINELIAGKPYEQHVVSRYYAIENSADDQTDSELLALRQHIVTVASQEPYMGEQIPKRWLAFEKFVAAAIKKGQHYMNLDEVTALSRQDLGINSEQVISTMLDFYHDLGTIIYFGNEDTNNTHLQDMVILDPQWLIDIFRRIITVMPHAKQWTTLRNKWRRLKEEGILEDHLIDHMWQDLLPQKPALLALMEMFDLLCPRLDAQEPHDTLTYYVPACLRPYSSKEKTQKSVPANSGKIVTFYIDFQGFLPDGLFHRLLVHAARWAQQSSGEEPKLFFRYGSFCLDDEHNFVLQMISTSPISIKVTLRKLQVLTSGAVDDNSNIDIHPCPKACSMVRTFLSNTLKELTATWIRGIRYEFSAACPCNDLQDQDVTTPFHLLCLDECLTPNKARIKCKENNMWIETEVFKTWFHSEDEMLEAVEDTKKVSETLSDVELLELAGEVGVDWKKLGIYLGLRASQIASINTDYPMTEDKAFHMLVRWRKGLSKTLDSRMLIGKALMKCDLVSLAEKYDSLEGAISNI